MARRSVLGIAAFMALVAACGGAVDSAPVGPIDPAVAVGPGDAGLASPPDAATAPPADAGLDADVVDPNFDARLKRMLHALLGPEYDAHDWDALLHAHPPYNGIHVWIPGTGERTDDDLSGKRAMGSVPDGLVAWGSAVDLGGGSATDTLTWLGIPSTQAEGGAEFSRWKNLSALEVFDTAWSDAQAIAGRLGASLHGAWIVGHSAGALPALLAGLVGGAHRIDVYGVPSAVGPLDGTDGDAHLYTHPLDPAGTMGTLDAQGRAQIDLLGAAATAIKAGQPLKYHDYSKYSAPAP